jgi:hypothetical protein
MLLERIVAPLSQSREHGLRVFGWLARQHIH